MAVKTQRFDVRDSDLDSQIGNAEPSGVTSIDSRNVVDEGQNHIRIVWFYTQ